MSKRQMIQQVDAIPNAVLEAKIAGKARDGGPACASVSLLDNGWQLIIYPEASNNQASGDEQ